MRIISYAWTWPAFVALAKTVTRRGWAYDYARHWKQGTEFIAYDRSPRYKGRPIGSGILTAPARLEPLADMPDSDYAAEGFAYLHAHPEVLPRAGRDTLRGECTSAAFHAWRKSGERLYTVRFRILTIESWAKEKLRALLASVAADS